MKYVPSALIGQLSKSQGSTTASRNRFGSYFRNRVQGVNPNTSGQQTIRELLQTLSQLYRTLTELQRNAWASLGAQMTRVDSLGQSYTLTGLQAYTSVNMNLFAIGDAFVSDAPLLAEPTTVEEYSLSVDNSAGEVELTYDVAGPAGSFFIIDAAAPRSAGINFVPRSDFRTIKVAAADGMVAAINAGTEYIAKFGSPPVGSKVFVRVKLINAAGFAGAPTIVSAITVA